MDDDLLQKSRWLADTYDLALSKNIPGLEDSFGFAYKNPGVYANPDRDQPWDKQNNRHGTTDLIGLHGELIAYSILHEQGLPCVLLTDRKLQMSGADLEIVGGDSAGPKYVNVKVVAQVTPSTFGVYFKTFQELQRLDAHTKLQQRLALVSTAKRTVWIGTFESMMPVLAQASRAGFYYVVNHKRLLEQPNVYKYTLS